MTFEETIQALIDFIDQPKQYDGKLTIGTAVQLLRDIEIDVKNNMVRK